MPTHKKTVNYADLKNCWLVKLLQGDPHIDNKASPACQCSVQLRDWNWLRLLASVRGCELQSSIEFHWHQELATTKTGVNFIRQIKLKSRSKLVISGEKALNAPRSCWACPPDRWLYILDPNPDIIDSRGWFLKHRLVWRQKNIPWMSTGRGGNVTIFNCLLLMPLQLINE